MKVNSIFLLSLAFLLACGGDDSKQIVDAVKPVKYAEALLSGGEQIRNFNGTSQSGSEANLSFRISGQIVKVNVKVGDRVRKGQVLAQLDQKDIGLSYEKAKAALQSTEIQLQTTKSSLDRTKSLYQANNASLSDYEAAKNNYAASSANYQSAKKNLNLEASNFQYSKIVAATAGVITAVNAKINEFAQAGNPIIVINSGTNDIEISVGMPERYITQISQSDLVQISFPSVNGASFAGAVSEVGFSTVNSATYPVIITVQNPTEAIRPGMPAKVAFTFGEKSDTPRLLVPFQSVGEDTQGNFVFRLNPEENNIYSSEKVYVTVGQLLPGGFEVVDGLKDGAFVATAGLGSLYDGRKVKLLQN
ncbi:MAG: efflux RND transporter periplasmic adaptor subunit [Calditrichia bacterium]